MVFSRANTADAGGAAELQGALQQALQFSPARARALLLPPGAIAQAAGDEAARGPVATDARGFTPGMRVALLEPARALLSEWAQARAPFDRRLQPFRERLEAAERLAAETDLLRGRKDEDIAQVEREAQQSHAYRERKAAFERADARLARYSEANGNRTANMSARHPVYLLALLCVGITEWLINYTTFLLFFGVPAIAAGTTLILAVLLAFASHGHGMLLKQWSHRFGHHAERIQRIADWRLLFLASLSLLVVLGAAGGSRDIAALDVMRAQSGPNILGPDVVVHSDPTVEVLLSLFANIGAWLVGIFFAYVCHDIDPEFTDATAQRRTAWRRFHRQRRRYDARIQQIEAKSARTLRETETAARARLDAVAPHKAMLDQIEAHDRAVRDAVVAAVRGNAERYRAALSEARVTGTALAVPLTPGEPPPPPAPVSVNRALLLELEGSA